MLSQGNSSCRQKEADHKDKLWEKARGGEFRQVTREGV